LSSRTRNNSSARAGSSKFNGTGLFIGVFDRNPGKPPESEVAPDEICGSTDER